MNRTHLFNSAALIVKRNLSSNVNTVAIQWSEERAELKLLYNFIAPPTDDDIELQELSMCELLAEFQDILLAKCSSESVSLNELVVKEKENFVYVRST